MKLKNKKIKLYYDNGSLRTLITNDVHQKYIDGLNDPRINKYLVDVRKNQQTKEKLEEYVQQNLDSDYNILFGIWVDGQDEFCGTVRLHSIEYTHRTAHIGVCLFDSDVWGRGIGKKSIKAATKWALNSLKLRWIEAGIYEENIISCKAFESAGYEKMFTIKDKYLYEDNPATVEIYAATNKEVKNF